LDKLANDDKVLPGEVLLCSMCAVRQCIRFPVRLFHACVIKCWNVEELELYPLNWTTVTTVLAITVDYGGFRWVPVFRQTGRGAILSDLSVCHLSENDTSECNPIGM